jgi:hypothetical protein
MGELFWDVIYLQLAPPLFPWPNTARIGQGKRGSASSARMADADATKTCVGNSEEIVRNSTMDED